MTARTATRVSLLLASTALVLLLAASTAFAIGTGAPVIVKPAKIGGKFIDEATVTASPGAWQGSATITFAYKWQRCNGAGETGSCADIAGASARKYKLQHADVGNTVRAIVTATNGEGQATADTPVSPVIKPSKPAKVKAPTITGPATDGKLETATNGIWKGTPPLTYTYQWKECVKTVCSVIAGATEQTYRPTTAEIGKQLRVVVTAHNAAGSSLGISSAASKKIIAGPPVNVGAPSVSGTPIDGQTLTANVGSWAGTPPYSFSYKWYSCPLLTEECSPIAGATEPTYQAGPLDVGNAIEVEVTAQSTYGKGAATSGPTSAVGALLPSNVKLPSIGGLLNDGQLLSVIGGIWNGTAPIALSYQWQLCNATGQACSDINGAVGTALSLISPYVGDTVRVIETATNAAGSVSVPSEPTSVIKALLPSVTELPSITGLLQDGQSLAASVGKWAGSEPLSFAYQWQLCNSAGEACQDIANATEGALALISSEVGNTVRVVVTATNSGGSTEAASEPTSLIKALLPGNTSLPSIAGLVQDGQSLAASVGSWTGSTPISYTYQWLQCNASGASCKEISGATGATLGLVSSLVGDTVKVVVTATNSGGSTEATSAASSVIKALLPGNTSLPSITGLVQDGQSLAASVGSWTGTTPISYAYQWQLCNSAGEACKDIKGATEGALALISSEVGNTVRVVVTATNSGGSTEAASAATSVIGALLPSNVSLPSIAGTLLDGQTLSAAAGSWEGTTPISYSYQWLQCNASGASCKEISGATGATLGLVSSLVGDTVKVVVTATNSGGSTEATSAASGVIAALLPKNTALPSIGGLLEDGQTLSAVTGSWSGSTPISYSYQWLQCNASGASCKEISGATGATLGLVSSLVGDTVKVVVTATNSGGSTEATSAATSVIKALLPSNVSLPSIAGSLIDGQTLTASNGSWEGSTPISYSYQWLQCNASGGSCKEISGATGGTLALVSSLVGDTVKVVVKATNSGGSTEATSAASGVIAALLPKNTSLPSIAGSLIDGQTLSAATGSWSGTTPISYSYQWLQCNASGGECKELSGATGATLGLVSSLVGNTVKVVVTATNSGGSTEATSAASSVIKALLPGNTKLPSIAGSLVDGQTLTASNGEWSGTTPISYSYQWQECNAKGEACKNLSGATGTTLGLVSSLVGNTVRVIVTATNSGGSTEQASAATGVIAALLPKNTALPGITGSLVDGQTLTASNGSWEGTSPISYSYQWQECNAKGEACKNLSGATGATLGLVSSLVGDTVKVVVKATNSGGSTEQASAATGVIAALLPKNTELPVITGAFEDTKSLSASNGSWSGTTPISYSYQWFKCNSAKEACTELSGATGSTLGLVSSLVGSTVKVVVKATNSGGSTEAASAVSSVILALLPKNLSLPTTSSSTEKVEQGSTLKATKGSWEGTEPEYSYQWQKCNAAGEPASCTNLTSKEETLSVVESLVKSTVRVVVTAKNSRGSTQAASAITAPVLASLPVNTKLPTVTGILQVGKELTANTALADWSGTKASEFTYQWQLCGALGLVSECKNIAGATHEKFLLELLDLGLTLRVGVVAHNERGASETAYSAVTGLIQGVKLSPVKGTAGTTVSVKGSEVNMATMVNFGSQEAFAEPVSSTEVTATAPSGETGTVPVTLSTSEGTTHETPSTQFTYTE